MSSHIKFAVLTSSDSVSVGARHDIGGDAVAERMSQAGHRLTHRAVVHDDRAALAEQITDWSMNEDVELVLTTGGTGLGPRDVMPEAMSDILHYEVPGISEAIRAGSLSITPMSMLSRAKAGVCGNTLIVNLPGSPKGAVESLDFVMSVLPHAVELLQSRHHGDHPVDRRM